MILALRDSTQKSRSDSEINKKGNIKNGEI